jgi:shikimate kinase
MQFNSVIFIGMAGVGKSAIGKTVALHLGLHFIDIDDLISNEFGAPLHDIINRYGESEFQRIESQFVVKSLGDQHILSPGGSFIYQNNTIDSIKNTTLFIYLFDTPEHILSRIPDIQSRGIIGINNKSFEELCVERHLLYESAANVKFNLNVYGFDVVTHQIIQYLKCLGVGRF